MRPSLLKLPLLFLPLLGLGACGSLVAQQDTAPPAAISGALYFDAWQLEKEFLVSPLALQQWIDLGLTPESRLTKEQREALKPKIGEFLGEKCPATIAGELIPFTLDRLHFIEPNDNEFALIDPEAEVSVADVRISAVFAAPNTNLTEPVLLLWNLFPPGIATVTVNAADVAGTRPFKVSKIAPSITVGGRYELGARDAPKAPPAPPQPTMGIPWLSIILILCAVPVTIRIVRGKKRSPAAVAVLVLLAGGAAAASKFATYPIAHPFPKADVMDEGKGARVLDSLLRGVYHSFDYRDQSEQYDVLAKVVGGDALTDIFLEVRRTLESREKDGARVRVNDLKVEECQPTPLKGRRGFEAECAWEVRGRVGHWGHFHDRTNLYRASFVIEPLAGTWKITGLTLHARDRKPGPTP